MRYLKGASGSIFYGGEEYMHPGGTKSEAELTELWQEKLTRKAHSAAAVIDHACSYWYIPEGGLKLVPKYTRTFEESDK